jgi:hypothetical protein
MKKIILILLLQPDKIAYFLQNILRQKLLRKSTAYQGIRLDFLNNFWRKIGSRNKRFYLVGVIMHLLLVSCAGAKKESPVIYFSNVSLEPIKEIRCFWGEKNTLTLPLLNPGDSRSQSFYIGKSSEFFGLIKILWKNSKDETVVKEFYFTSKNLPSMSERDAYNYVQLYIDQEDVEIVTSDVADLSSKTRRMEKILVQNRAQYFESHPKAVATSLIRVQTKASDVPSWIANP